MEGPLNSNFEKQYQKDRNQAIGFGGAVYTGGVIAATIIFLSFIMTAFPETAYFIRALMVLAGLFVGASGLAFPVALHKWAIGGTHRLIAMILYYGEIFILVLNTIVSFSALLFKFAGNTLPPWVQWYEPFTIFSLGYVIFSWGTIFITDPHSQARNQEKEAFDKIVTDTAASMRQYIQSEAGKRAIQARAEKKLDDIFNIASTNPFDNLGTPCDHCGISNPAGTRYCSQCGAPQRSQAPAATQTRPSLPSPAPIGPGILPPRIAPKSSYTLDSLLASIGKSPEEARDLIRHYGLWDAMTAYTALHSSGYLPAGITQSDFMPLFCELFGVAPTWGSIAGLSVPPASAAAPGGNGASNKSF